MCSKREQQERARARSASSGAYEEDGTRQHTRREEHVLFPVLSLERLVKESGRIARRHCHEWGGTPRVTRWQGAEHRPWPRAAVSTTVASSSSRIASGPKVRAFRNSQHGRQGRQSKENSNENSKENSSRSDEQKEVAGAASEVKSRPVKQNRVPSRWCVVKWCTPPIKTKSSSAAVMSPPRLAGERNPSTAKIMVITVIVSVCTPVPTSTESIIGARGGRKTSPCTCRMAIAYVRLQKAHAALLKRHSERRHASAQAGVAFQSSPPPRLMACEQQHLEDV